MKTTNPSDTTPENDYWSQKGEEIEFKFNDGHSEYSGTMKKAKSTSGEWQWKMTRIK